VIAGASIELAARLLGRQCSVERPITVDQTNVSVVVDEAVVVKWLRPPVPSPHPGVQLIRHLAAAGFNEMPAFLGVDERDDVVHAIVTSYLPGALDGWDWYVDDVEA
jgi:maltokinase